MVAPCTKASVLSLSSLLKSRRIGLGLPWLQHTGGSVLAVISQTHSPPSCLQQLKVPQDGESSPFCPQINSSVFSAVRLYLIGSNGDDDDDDDQSTSKIKITSTYSSLLI